MWNNFHCCLYCNVLLLNREIESLKQSRIQSKIQQLKKSQERLALQTQQSNLESERKAEAIRARERGIMGIDCHSDDKNRVSMNEVGINGVGAVHPRSGRLEIDETEEQKRLRRQQVLELISDGEHLMENPPSADGHSPAQSPVDKPVTCVGEESAAFHTRPAVGIQLKKALVAKPKSMFVVEEDAEAESAEEHRKRQRLAALEEEKNQYSGNGTSANSQALDSNTSGQGNTSQIQSAAVPKKDLLAPAAAMAAAFAEQYNRSQSELSKSKSPKSSISELDKKTKQKRIVDSIPTERKALFEYRVDWDICFNNNVRFFVAACFAFCGQFYLFLFLFSLF